MMTRIVVAVLLCAGSAGAAGLSPAESLKQFKPAEGLEVTLAASEPAVRQPVCINFDARGRMWVVQYLQYPHPAGLKALRVDPYLRTTYDKVPQPPPAGVKGADKITIFEDPDEKGFYRKHKDFVTGLNMATSVEFGNGGVYVMNAPYLLFYPDKNGDDIPDSEPKVLLSGFGLEDTHAIASHLTWGPDGWLYGCQGSTCTANVRGQSFQQAAWRYHPKTEQFEVFAEGGGNTFGLEWDEHGNLLTGTNYSRFVMVHYVQGGYFIKSFGKHGPLHNPYAFGYFDHVPHEGWRGGHVTQLGVLYQGGALPEKYNGKWIAPNVLANTVDVHKVTPVGSTFKTDFDGEFVSSSDICFRPVDIRTGPDGAIYLADWYDKRANHVIPEDTWDKDTGRIWRVAAKGSQPARPFDLEKRTGAELVALLDHPNDWYARTARRILRDREGAGIDVNHIKKQMFESEGRKALQSLWVFNAIYGGGQNTTEPLLKHPSPDVRAWAVRLWTDIGTNQLLGKELAELARMEKSQVVRCQLAASARRVPAATAIDISRALIGHDEDVTDRYLPLMIWWAIESHAGSKQDDVLKLYDSAAVWEAPIARKFITERIARRWTAERSAKNFEACAKLLDAAPANEDVQRVLAGIDLGLDGAKIDDTAKPLVAAVNKRWQAARDKPSPLLVRVALRLNIAEALPVAMKLAADDSFPALDRAGLARGVGAAGGDEAIALLAKLLAAKEPKEVRLAAAGSLAKLDDPKATSSLIGAFAKMTPEVRNVAAAGMLARKPSAKALVAAVESGAIKPDMILPEQIARVTLYGDADLSGRVGKVWGNALPASEQEKKDSAARARKALSEGKSDPIAGQVVFTAYCGKCHAVRGIGGRTAPDLTGFDRRHQTFLIDNIVDPSALIRPEYAQTVVKTTDGELLSGFVVEAGDSVTVDEGMTKTVIAREKIASMDPSPRSVMPEKQLDTMTEQQIRDLFAFLCGEGPRQGKNN